MAEYNVSIQCDFDADTPLEAVRKFQKFLSYYAEQACYDVQDLATWEITTIDFEEGDAENDYSVAVVY